MTDQLNCTDTHMCKGILFSHEKEVFSVICNNVDGS